MTFWRKLLVYEFGRILLPKKQCLSEPGSCDQGYFRSVQYKLRVPQNLPRKNFKNFLHFFLEIKMVFEFFLTSIHRAIQMSKTGHHLRSEVLNNLTTYRHSRISFHTGIICHHFCGSILEIKLQLRLLIFCFLILLGLAYFVRFTNNFL